MAKERVIYGNALHYRLQIRICVIGGARGVVEICHARVVSIGAPANFVHGIGGIVAGCRKGARIVTKRLLMSGRKRISKYYNTKLCFETYS
jgi:hypothetical protein